MTLVKTVTIRNLENSRRTYTVTPTFRYASDAALGAITVDAPTTVTVKQGLGRETTFEVAITIDGSLLWRGNFMNSGSGGANPVRPDTEHEFDGYLILDDGEPPDPPGVARAAAQGGAGDAGSDDAGLQRREC